MTESTNPARARAEAAFRRTVTPEEKSSAMEEYRAQQQAVLDKTARLRAARLARDAAPPAPARRRKGRKR
jgi:hypothetical protein